MRKAVKIMSIILGVLLIIALGMCGSRFLGIGTLKPRKLQMETGVITRPRSRDEIQITRDAVSRSVRKAIKESGAYEKFEYTTRTYDDEDRVVEKYANVYVPYGYDPDDTETKYDVMYLFHGYGGDATTFMGSPEEPRDFKNVVDQLIEKGLMRPMIIVNATYYSDNEDQGKDNYDIEILENYRNELIHDLIPAVEGAYHTYENRDHRIFAGFSMGGVMTISRLMDSMDYFRYFMDMSGPIYWSIHNSGSGEETWAGAYIADKIREQGYGRDDFYLYVAVGTADFAQDPVDQMMRSIELQTDMFTVDNMTAAGNVTFWHGEGEKHSYHAKRMYLYNALPVFSALIDNESE